MPKVKIARLPIVKLTTLWENTYLSFSFFIFRIAPAAFHDASRIQLPRDVNDAGARRPATGNVKGNFYDRGFEIARLHPTLLAIGAAGLPELVGGYRPFAHRAASAARSR